MAQLTFNVPDDLMDDLVEAWSGPDWELRAKEGETQAQFAKRMIARTIAEPIRQKQAEQLPEIPIT